MPELELNGRRAYSGDGGVPWQPGRPVVAFVHGAGMTHAVWQQQARALAHHGFNVATPDLPGHGRSEDVPGLAGVEDYAAWLHALLGALGAAPAALVGHSLGAAIALTLAATHPDAVSALALLGARAAMSVSPRLLADLRDDPPRAVAFVAAYAHGRGAHVGGAPTPGTWLVGGSQALLAACPPEVLLRDFQASNDWQGSAYLGRVRCPTLVLSGSDDRMTPARYGRELAEAIPGARYEQLPGAGHMLHTEAPRPVLDRLRAFLGSLGA